MAGFESTCVARDTYKVILRAGSLEAAHSSFRIFRNSNNGRVLFSRKLHLADVLTRALRAQAFHPARRSSWAQRIRMVECARRHTELISLAPEVVCRAARHRFTSAVQFRTTLSWAPKGDSPVLITKR